MSQRTIVYGSIMSISACIAGFSYCATSLNDGYSPALSQTGTVAEGVAFLTVIWSGLLMNRFKTSVLRWFSRTLVQYYSCLCISACWLILSLSLLSQAQYECQGQADPDASLISSGVSRLYCWIPATAGTLGFVIIVLAVYQAMIMRRAQQKDSGSSHQEKSDDDQDQLTSSQA